MDWLDTQEHVLDRTEELCWCRVSLPFGDRNERIIGIVEQDVRNVILDSVSREVEWPLSDELENP